MKNKISQLIKRFNAWLIRVNNWFLHPSPLSLLISLLAPVFFLVLICLLSNAFPDFFLTFSSSLSADGLTYEIWIGCLLFFRFGFNSCFVFWLFDLIKYIISLFRKSSAPADDK